MFTLRERFLASDVWMRLWYAASLGLAYYLLFVSLDVSPSAFESPAFLLLTFLAVIAATLLTLVLAPIAAFFVFFDVIERQGQRNGGPFDVGDRVVLIAGRNAGRQGVVSSFGQGRTLRITLDGEEKELDEVFSDYQIKRVDFKQANLES